MWWRALLSVRKLLHPVHRQRPQVSALVSTTALGSPSVREKRPASTQLFDGHDCALLCLLQRDKFWVARGTC